MTQILPKVVKKSQLAWTCPRCEYEVGTWIKCLCDQHTRAPRFCPSCGAPSAPALNAPKTKG